MSRIFETNYGHLYNSTNTQCDFVRKKVYKTKVYVDRYEYLT